MFIILLTRTCCGWWYWSCRCLTCHILSWSYNGVCSDTEYNNSVGRKVSQCVLCGWCVSSWISYSISTKANFINDNFTIGFWRRAPCDSELCHCCSGWKIRHWARNCINMHYADVQEYSHNDAYTAEYNNHSPSCSVFTMSGALYDPTPPKFTPATSIE